MQKRWDILHSEHEWANPSSKKPYFENNINSFQDVLLSIKELAKKIECENFVNIFTSTINLLDGYSEYPDGKYGLSLPSIPQQNLQVFEAVSTSDVFGAMGSWNDSPAYMAHKKGLSKEYETLSSELLKNVRLAILYAINEWQDYKPTLHMCKLEFTEENIDETIFMFAPFKCRKSGKGRNRK